MLSMGPHDNFSGKKIKDVSAKVINVSFCCLKLHLLSKVPRINIFGGNLGVLLSQKEQTEARAAPTLPRTCPGRGTRGRTVLTSPRPQP